ncbi:MAG: glycosyltransferase [Pseudomonadota bacterium]
MTPDIAIVIPIYRHSALADEAISSALALEGNLDHVVIAVDDGCPNVETRAALDGWARHAPDRFHHLHQANSGLSAARNTGIRFALSKYPALRGVFPLDADNRLDAHSLTLFEHLLHTEEADWFYPNFDMFGLQSYAHNGGRFALPLFAASNQCEAGSLIRREVFDAGVWFDEEMRAGYEDWDFWLSAARAGFQGAPVRQNFFRYRKRPESMLSGSHDQDTVLRSVIQKKHGWLYDKDSIAQLAAQQIPRFACFEGDAVQVFTDPADRTDSDREALIHQVIKGRARPETEWVHQNWVFTRPGVIDLLSRCKLSQSILWHLQAGLMKADIAALRVVQDPGGQRKVDVTIPAEHPKNIAYDTPPNRRLWHVDNRTYKRDRSRQAEVLEQADVLMVSRDMIQRLGFPDGTDLAMKGRRAARILKAASVLHVRAAINHPRPDRSGPPPRDMLEQFTRDLREHPHANGYVLHDLKPWRDPPRAASAKDIGWIQHNHGFHTAPFPIVTPPGTRRIGIALPIMQFGGVEKCAVALAAALKRQNVQCHLFVYGNSQMAGTDWLFEPFETVHQLNHPLLRDWRGGQYLGTNTAAPPPTHLLNQMVGPLLSMDAVISTGSAAIFHGLSALRSKRVAVASWEHLVETGGYGRVYGTPYLGVAYEGGLDRILTCSKRLASWMHAQGVPSEKLVPLPNGPGFPLDADQVAAALAARADRPDDARLRVGFLGRLDNQKGADRYLAIARACRDLPIDFSITGSAVIGESGLSVPPEITHYPAAFEVEDLREAFARLDILLMPSRDEGLPLTIMEAQRVGLIPIATDVGAVSEAIEDGVNGFLIKGSPVVSQMVALLRRLATEPGLRRSVSGELGGVDQRWDQNATAVIDALL